MTKLKKGMKVKIISDEATTKIGWMLGNMKPFVGTNQIVSGMYVDNSNPDETSAIVAGYHWHPKDIRPLGKKISIPKPQLFDVEKLVI